MNPPRAVESAWLINCLLLQLRFHCRFECKGRLVIGNLHFLNSRFKSSRGMFACLSDRSRSNELADREDVWFSAIVSLTVYVLRLFSSC